MISIIANNPIFITSKTKGTNKKYIYSMDFQKKKQSTNHSISYFTKKSIIISLLKLISKQKTKGKYNNLFIKKLPFFLLDAKCVIKWDRKSMNFSNRS